MLCPRQPVEGNSAWPLGMVESSCPVLFTLCKLSREVFAGLGSGGVRVRTAAGRAEVHLSCTRGRGRLWGFLVHSTSVSEMLKILN